ncbi:MAG: AmmeMemoRadiSam system radical SAM enzyme [Prevotella sp.]|jgi:pyruvate formate lyase activating enzyme|nr:AmmeMemoRadiSam system radical SAM enzyme [Prevotella sp.]
MECRYYTRLDNGAVRCDLCPHGCTLREGQRGLCRSRRNEGGSLVSDVYGRPCSIADDPVEKKPLMEFHPGTRCLSIACTGCNLRCKNCQNHEISQVFPDEVTSTHLMPEEVVRLCKQYHLPAIAYTYTEPLTYFEYIEDIARLAHEEHLYNILVSAGYVNPEPLREIAPLLDAANIDLKVFSDSIYRKLNGATLQPVLDTLLTLKEMGVHLEITNLLIPEINDDEQLIRDMCRWLVGHGFADNPLHFSRFFPCYKLSDSYPTPVSTLHKARKIAMEEGMTSIYLGNV